VGESFPHPSRPALWPTQPPVHDVGSFPGVKPSVLSCNRPPSSSVKVKERINLYCYYVFCVFMADDRATFVALLLLLLLLLLSFPVLIE
jgi:hypothetical protein